MKKLIKILKYLLIIPLFLTSCHTPFIDHEISFLDEQKASFYYFGKESTLFSRLNYYSDIVPSEFPDIETNPIETDYIAFGIDVKNKEDEITITLLDQIYDYLESEKYVFVYFMNYDDLSVLRRSKFRAYSNQTANDRLAHEIFIVDNYFRGSRTIHSQKGQCGYDSEEHKTEESLYSFVLGTYYYQITELLSDQ